MSERKPKALYPAHTVHNYQAYCFVHRIPMGTNGVCSQCCFVRGYYLVPIKTSIVGDWPKGEGR